ncbi:MAG: bifunctional riboflavin kinase/FAD synthetase [Candidatus Krumholzibacteriota bacterium]|nr:bifunctional riboflavin kinase/FAD synthetase [Candidatus Krumholzibacteriota bacterium]
MTEVIRSDDLLDLNIVDSTVTVGVFDGVHVGHRKVISSLLETTEKSTGRKSILLTFDPHPLSVTHPDRNPQLLTTIDEKISLLKKLGIDIIVIERFDEKLSAIDYREFISNRLIGRLGMRHLVIGYDFHLGRNRTGDHEHLCREGRESGFAVTVVPPVIIDSEAVSSTRIRDDVREKRLREAARLLTRHYFFDADVVHGEGIGRKLDFPTANAVITHREKLVPPAGVYAVRIEVEKNIFDGMMNIGSAPTIRSDGDEKIEVHLFDFSGDLYGRRLRIHLLEYLRDEKNFASCGELQAQLLRDREKVRKILEKSIDFIDK